MAPPQARLVMSPCTVHVPPRFGVSAREDCGATAVEYALMVSLIALVIIGGVTVFGLSVKGLFQLIVATAPFH
jgi:pilus assembly protein Flp/PilA